MPELCYPMFDGERVWNGAAVTTENGIITSVRECDPAMCGDGFLMPGLTDAHTHINTSADINAMLDAGITTVCDVSASKSLVEASQQLDIVSSGGMAMGLVLNAGGYVEQAVANGARYIKVLLFNTLSVGKPALRGIVNAAHAKGLKVAVHATEVATVRQAADAGADILLHIPMKEAFPPELAAKIAEKGIAVAPTLVMMKTFAHSGRGGYNPDDYQNAVDGVRLLHRNNVNILAATDANPGSFAPAVGYGQTLHYEMELLADAGLSSTEVLAAATGNSAAAFGLNAGRIAPGQPASMLLAEGRPDRHISDIRHIRHIWVKGEAIR